MTKSRFFALCLGLVLLGAASSFLSGHTDIRSEDDGLGTPYIVSRADNVCGLTDPAKLSCPASVAYAKAIASTPQARKLRRRRIDPNSAEGIILMNRAGAAVRDACAAVQREKSLCSVWKKIRRRDGGPLPDVTSAVIKEINHAPAPLPAQSSHSPPTSSTESTSVTHLTDTPDSRSQY